MFATLVIATFPDVLKIAVLGYLEFSENSLRNSGTWHSSAHATFRGSSQACHTCVAQLCLITNDFWYCSTFLLLQKNFSVIINNLYSNAHTNQIVFWTKHVCTPRLQKVSRAVVFNLFVPVPPDVISLQFCTPKRCWCIIQSIIYS
jgi:hypothetical protein